MWEVHDGLVVGFGTQGPGFAIRESAEVKLLDGELKPILW